MAPKLMKLLIGAVLCGVLTFMTACDFEINELDTLRVGQSKTDVLEQLASQGVQDVVPILTDPILIEQDQIDELDKLYGVSGICLSNSHGISLHLNFDEKNKLTGLYTSPKMKSESFGIAVNQSKQRVISLLKKAMEEDDKLVVRNCIFNARWIRLKQIQEKDIVYLQRYSAWRYHQSNSYSYVTLKFVNDKLTKIRYHWRPFEV